jgi:hypothetical protein
LKPVCGQARKQQQHITRYSHKCGYLSIYVRKHSTIVQPVVTYAAQVWAQPTQTQRKMLDSWQMGLVTRAFRCHAKISHICLQQELGLFPLHVTCDTLAIR